MSEPLDLDTRIMVLAAGMELEGRPFEKAIVNDAQAEIERLRAEVARLTEGMEREWGEEVGNGYVLVHPSRRGAAAASDAFDRPLVSRFVSPWKEETR